MKEIAILGATGSIGLTALKVIRTNPEKYRVIALSAGRNVDLLLEQVKEFRPLAVGFLQEEDVSGLGTAFADQGVTKVFKGPRGLVDLVRMPEVDTVISAVTGAAGLIPTYEAIKAGKHVALANKETMVLAGPLIKTEAEKQGVSVLPVDSEHSAILQCLQGHRREDLSRVMLTASGGPFRGLSLDQMREVTPAQALKHPNWSMGQKISVDSATLMNKGLETIEAKWFFDLEWDQIGILIHPESIVHSMVVYRDGSIIAQMGVPDMLIPIAYALSFPSHEKNDLPPLELEKIKALTFQKPDLKKFPCLRLALDAANAGGTMPVVLNGANEVAVESFLAGRIGFLQIPALIEEALQGHEPQPIDSVETIMDADRWARDRVFRALTRV